MLKNLGREIKWWFRAAKLSRLRERVFLSTQPGHFYSPIPSVESVQAYKDTLPREVTGIDLRENEQKAWVTTLAPLIQSHCFPVQQTPDRRYYLENLYFPYADALLTQALLRYLKPSRLVEVGSGFSSASMLDTQDHFGLKTCFTFVDPYPERIHSLLRPGDQNQARVLAKKVQEIPLGEFESLQSGDILFIDSSHVVKFDSDVHFLFFEVLPRLKSGVWVHIHDIFWPFEYPKNWLERGWAWNENYFLHALLLHSSRYQMEIFPSWLEFAHRDLLAKHWPTTLKRSKTNTTVGGASFWMSVR
jgi:hypothetical protein